MMLSPATQQAATEVVEQIARLTSKEVVPA